MISSEVQGSALELVDATNTENPSQPEFLTIAEAARVLRVDRSTLTEAIRRGDISAVQVGKRRMVPRYALTPKAKAPTFDPILAQEMFYQTLLMQINALTKTANAVEAFLATHSSDPEWRTRAKRIPNC